MTWTKPALLALVLAPAAVAPAMAQTPDERRLSLNLGAGVVFAADPQFDGAVMQISVGTDLRLAPRWDVRIEAAGRLPASQHSIDFTPQVFEGSRGTTRRLDVTTRLTKHTLADLSVLGRRYWIGEHAEGALLFGVDVNLARYRTILEIPRNPDQPTDFDPVTTRATRAHLVFDFGTELGFPVSDRWTIFAYGIAGLQPPATENRLWQPRAGVFIRRR